MTSFRSIICDGRVGIGVAVVSALALMSCSEYSTQQTQAPSPGRLQAMKGDPLTASHNYSEAGDAVKTAGNGFNGRLSKEYLDIAGERSASKDLVDVDYFSRKSIAAASGDDTMPIDQKNRSIPMQSSLNTRGEMDASRQRLLSALDAGGRDKYPVLAARAQARYDCWVERTEADYRNEFNGKCRQQFVSALSDLEVLMHPPGPYQVYFDSGSAKIGPEGLQSLQAAAAALPKAGTSRLEVIGKADKTGSEMLNQKLSQDRAEAVRSTLASSGVDPSRIDVHAVGESQPPVPTADGVKEPRNRVTDVTTMVPEATYK